MPTLARLTLGAILLLVICTAPRVLADDSQGSGTPALAEPIPQIVITSVSSIPAARQADRIAIITVKGPIDSTTALSVRRRITAAENAGMDAMVIEIDSPGGELGAVLEISNTIKQSSITNTVAWVRPDAYSGGAIIALACQEIVSSSPASMGDAFVIQMGFDGMVKALSPTERTKFLPPLMADVTDSARKSGFDEYLVQAIVVDGIELWMVEDIETGERISINEEEYRLLFDGDVVRGKPMLAAVTGGVQTYANAPSEDEKEPEKEPNENKDQAQDHSAADQSRSDGPQGQEEDQEVEDRLSDPNAYQPASPTLRDVEREFNDPEQVFGLEYPSSRVVFTSEHREKYRLVGYITDGSAAIVMRDDQLQYFGFSSGIIQDDEELKAFFGANELIRVNESVTEKAVRFMTSWPVKGFLIAVFLIAMFAEMIMGGTGIAGSVAIGALVLLLGPSAMIGLSGWWELIAILVGIACLAIEAFIIPGFGVFGVIGFVSLFGGLMGTFISSGGSLSNPATQQDMTTGAVTVLLAFVTAGLGWWLIVKNAQNLPVFDKLILSGASGVGSIPPKSMLHAIVVDDGSVRVGSEGVTTTPLHPGGQGEFNDQIVDIYAAFGTIEKGTAVRVVSTSALRIEVEEIANDSQTPGGDEGLA